MEVLRAGHSYKLAPFEPDGEEQVLNFIERGNVAGPGEAERFGTILSGTTNEEVLRVLIDRMRFLQDKLSSEENASTIEHLEAALALLGERTADRKERGVEGTDQA